jgi:hypothetical protein
MRYSDHCPHCGAALLIGTVEGVAPHIKDAGFIGTTVVVMHAQPLCEPALIESRGVEKQVADKIAEVDAKKQARENAIAKIRAEEEQRVQDRITAAMNEETPRQSRRNRE